LFILFGINFEWKTEKVKTPLLEITLAVNHSEKLKTKADFLAQANQVGSGDSEETQAIYSQLDTPYQSQQTEPIAQQNNQRRTSEDFPFLQGESDDVWSLSEPDKNTPEQTVEDPVNEQLMQQDIASLQAHLNQLKNTYAKMPRVMRLTSVSTQYAEAASYLLEWQQKIEQVGTRFYPENAKLEGIEGDVRLMVAINTDGSIKEVRLLASSGYTILDQAARNIVYLSSPFKPFPLEIAKKTDILEIFRTWQFRNDRLSSRAK
jgi:protein TonB